MSVEDFCNPDIDFQIGVAPFRIDFLTAIDRVEFADAWQNRLETSFGEIKLTVISRNELLANKKASGRPKDLVDAAWLESQNG